MRCAPRSSARFCDMPSELPAALPGRRTVQAALALGAGACALGAAALPFAAALLEPAVFPDPRIEPPFLDVAAERDVREGAPLRALLRAPLRDGFFTVLQDLGPVWLVREGPRLLALSATCPHLGCAVRSDGKGFLCPCHDSRFALDGAFVHGPSPRALDPLPVRVESGRVLVQPLRFKPGTRERRQL